MKKKSNYDGNHFQNEKYKKIEWINNSNKRMVARS